MPGTSFATSGTAGEHRLMERGFQNDGTLYRVRVSNDQYNLGGGVVTGGPLGVGDSGAISTVIAAGSSLQLRYVRLDQFTWDDFGTVCQLSLTWNVEPLVGEPAESRRALR